MFIPGDLAWLGASKGDLTRLAGTRVSVAGKLQALEVGATALLALALEQICGNLKGLISATISNNKTSLLQTGSWKKLVCCRRVPVGFEAAGRPEPRAAPNPSAAN